MDRGRDVGERFSLRPDLEKQLCKPLCRKHFGGSSVFFQSDGGGPGPDSRATIF